jgi:histidine triad (HIT) family protein
LFKHELDDYSCPFCIVVKGGETPFNTQLDVVRQTDLATALICPKWWPNNNGHVLVIPNEHHENLYDLPSSLGYGIHDLVQEIAIAMRETYDCDGISTQQHNEPAGNQDVWHYHAHVFPALSWRQPLWEPSRTRIRCCRTSFGLRG